jgi:hypothetical protein
MTFPSHIQRAATSTSTGAGPRKIAINTSVYVNNGLVNPDASWPLIHYAPESNTSGEVGYIALGLWGVPQAERDSILHSSGHLRALSRHHPFAPIVHIETGTSLSSNEYVVYGNDPDSWTLKQWLAKKVFDDRARLKICTDIARGVQQLHNALTTNLGLDTALIHIDDNRCISMYPIGRTQAGPLGQLDDAELAQLDSRAQEDLQHLSAAMLEILELHHVEACPDPDLRKILRHLNNGLYLSAEDLVEDLDCLYEAEPVEWMHHSTFSLVKYLIRKHKAMSAAIVFLCFLIMTMLVVLTKETVERQASQKTAESYVSAWDVVFLGTRYGIPDLLPGMRDNVSKAIDQGNYEDALEVIHGLNISHNKFRSELPEITKKAGRVIAGLRLRLLLLDPPLSITKEELLEATIRDAYTDNLWDWLLNEASTYSDVLVATAMDLEGLAVDPVYEQQTELSQSPPLESK